MRLSIGELLFTDPHHIDLVDQLLDKQMLEFNMFCFLSCVLVAMLLPLDESVCILMFALLLFSRSVSKFWKCSASVDPVLIA